MKKLIFTLLFLLLLAQSSFATIWYVRPSTAEYGAEDGATYATAFDGFTDIVWGGAGVVAGDTLYVCGTNREQLTVGASGSAGLPIIIRGDYPGDAGTILGSRTCAAGWNGTETPLWRCINTYATQIGNIIFNSETSVGVKKALKTNLAAQGDFWWDDPNDYIYLYSTSNPATYYSSIELAQKQDAIYIGDKNYITVQDLTLKYAGGFGIEVLHGTYLIFTKNNISFIGGAYSSGTVRYGNGIQLAGNIDHITTTYNRVDNIYDAGLTNQAAAGATRSHTYLYYQYNIITNSEYSFESYMGDATDTMNHIYFENNTCRNAGSGWGHSQRSDPSGRHFMMWTNLATTSDYYVRNNIFDTATESAIKIAAVLDINDALLDYNDYNVSVMALVLATTYTTLADWQGASTSDDHSISADPKFTNPTGGDFRLLGNSPAIDTGTNLSLTLDYRGTKVPRGSAPDIGALEYWPKIYFPPSKLYTNPIDIRRLSFEPY